MLSHVTPGTADWPKTRPFWIAIMEVLGHPVLFERESGIAFGLPTGTKTFTGPAYDGTRRARATASTWPISHLTEPRSTGSTLLDWPMAEPTKARHDCARVTTPTITALMSATPMATSFRWFAIQGLASQSGYRP